MSVVKESVDTDTAALFDRSPRIPELDGLRGLAIAGVLTDHCVIPYLQPQFHTGLWHVLMWPFTFGWLGVDLFFVLSGFLITSILLSTKGQPRYFINFYARRTLRIFPIYYTVLLLTALCFGLVPKLRASFPDDYHYLNFHWFYLQNWLPALITKPAMTDLKLISHFWSLAIEEQFYLTWPLLIYLLRETWLRRVCIALPLLALAIRVVVALAEPGLAGQRFIYYSTLTHLDGLAMGAWVALMIRSQASRAQIMRFASFSAIAVLLAFLVIIEMNPLRPFWGNMPMAVVGLSGAALGFTSALLHALCTSPDSGIRQWLTHSWLRRLGKYSYSIYILHVPVILAVDRMLAGLTGIYYVLPFLILVPLFLAGLALLSWHVIESPFLSLKKRFSF